jgi:hypothetical protein
MYRYELDTLQPLPQNALQTADQEEGVDYGCYGFMFSVRAKNVPIVITGIQVRAGALACRAHPQRTIGTERPSAPHQRLLSLSACRARDQLRPCVARFLVAALTAPPRPLACAQICSAMGTPFDYKVHVCRGGWREARYDAARLRPPRPLPARPGRSWEPSRAEPSAPGAAGRCAAAGRASTCPTTRTGSTGRCPSPATAWRSRRARHAPSSSTGCLLPPLRLPALTTTWDVSV